MLERVRNNPKIGEGWKSTLDGDENQPLIGDENQPLVGNEKQTWKGWENEKIESASMREIYRKFVSILFWVNSEFIQSPT